MKCNNSDPAPEIFNRRQGEEMEAINSIAGEFMSAFKQGRQPPAENILVLCEKCFDPDRHIASAAVSALYHFIVEGLCDDFTPQGIETANMVLLTILDFVRHQPGGEEIDGLLKYFGFAATRDLSLRYDELLRPEPLTETGISGVKKIFILSRITIGADVAIVSIIIFRILRKCIDAEVVMIGPDHLQQLFGGIERIRFMPFPYKRRGDLFDRTRPWIELHRLVSEETAALAQHEYLLFDPDSRLTQLGLLPLVASESTYYYNSRQYYPDNRCSHAESVNKWLNVILGEDIAATPRLSIDPMYYSRTRTFMQSARLTTRFVIVVNLGVGSNCSKRLPDPFESELLETLTVALPDALILLDSGSSPSGTERVTAILQSARDKGIDTVFFKENEFEDATLRRGCRIVGFKGTIGAIGALIDQADVFFGYDSCCQHISNALRTPAVIVFAGAPSDRFLTKWKPYDSIGRNVVFPVADSNAVKEDERRKLITAIVESMKKIYAQRACQAG